MELKHVESSVIRSIGYDPVTAVLHVEFRSGRAYRYLNVPSEQHAALMAAESIGRYFNQEIRPRYRNVKVK